MELTQAVVDLLIECWKRRESGPLVQIEAVAAQMQITAEESGRRYAVLEAYGLVRTIARVAREGAPILIELTPQGADFAETMASRDGGTEAAARTQG